MSVATNAGSRQIWRVSHRARRWAGAAALVLALPAAGTAQSADAQESRAAVLEAEAAEKATRLRPYEFNNAERRFIEFKDDLIGAPNGFYPMFGSIYSGGGFTAGAGYRRFYGDRTHWDVSGLLSAKAYKLIELSTNSLGHGHGRLDLHARAGWRDATQVAFHGLGIESSEDRANFRMKQTYVSGELQFRPVRPVIFAGALAFEDFALEEGRGAAPSIEEVFTPATAPGLGASPSYLHAYAAAAIDSRPGAGYARRGGLFALSYHNYADRDSTYSFDRLDAEIVQHVPILRENWVLSFRGLMQTTLHDDDLVPYFLLPSLGSGSTLRGYSSWRFRDRHSVLATGEFRWIPSRLALDMAIFYDTGQVAAERDGFQLRQLKSNVGFGVRFHGPLATPLRIELARGSEGMRLVFAGSAAF